MAASAPVQAGATGAPAGPGRPASGMPRAPLIAALLVGAVAIVLRVRCFHPYADTWDPCEYVWAVQGGYLPHSPYILYLWLGKLAALVMPADAGLAAISLVAGLAATACVGLLVGRQSGSAAAGCAASGALAVFPCAVWFSGIQEVYAPAAALVLAGLLLGGARGARGGALSGLVFGCALATHSGMIFAAPAWALALSGWPARGARGGAEADRAARETTRLPGKGRPAGPPSWRAATRRLAAGAAAAAIAPAAAVAWVAWVLPRGEAARQGLLSYLVGIAPLPEKSPVPLTDSLAQSLSGVIDQTLSSGITVPVLAACAAAAFATFPRVASFWLLHAAPYLAYETLIGWNVDPGIHMVFAGPAIAALLGCGVAAAARTARGARPRRAALAAAIPGALALTLVPAARASHDLSATVVSRQAYLSSEPVRTLIALRTILPADALVVQPQALDNPNLIPAYSGRRPIIFQAGMYLVFEGVRGSPLNLGSFSRLTHPRLEALAASGSPVVSLVDDPFPVSAIGLTWRREGNLYRLERLR